MTARRSWKPVTAAGCLLLLGSTFCCLAGAQIETVTDLKETIYTRLPLGRGGISGDACVRLLTASGIVGCAAPTGRAPTEGRLVRLLALRKPEEYPGEADRLHHSNQNGKL